MINDEFFLCLQALLEDEWQPFVEPAGEVRLRSTSRFALEALKHVCPIAAVSFAKSGVLYNNAMITEMAQILGLAETFARSLASAIDNPNSPHSSLRRRVLDVLRLQQLPDSTPAERK